MKMLPVRHQFWNRHLQCLGEQNDGAEPYVVTNVTPDRCSPWESFGSDECGDRRENANADSNEHVGLGKPEIFFSPLTVKFFTTVTPRLLVCGLPLSPLGFTSTQSLHDIHFVVLLRAESLDPFSDAAIVSNSGSSEICIATHGGPSMGHSKKGATILTAFHRDCSPSDFSEWDDSSAPVTAGVDCEIEDCMREPHLFSDLNPVFQVSWSINDHNAKPSLVRAKTIQVSRCLIFVCEQAKQEFTIGRESNVDCCDGKRSPGVRNGPHRNTKDELVRQEIIRLVHRHTFMLRRDFGNGNSKQNQARLIPVCCRHRCDSSSGGDVRSLQREVRHQAVQLHVQLPSDRVQVQDCHIPATTLNVADVTAIQPTSVSEVFLGESTSFPEVPNSLANAQQYFVIIHDDGECRQSLKVGPPDLSGANWGKMGSIKRH